MKTKLPLAVLALACSLSQLNAQDASPQSIDDRAIRTQFEAKLGKLKDDGETPDHEELQKQLRERKHHAIDLPETKDDGAKGTPGVYRERKDSVLCFGHIYKCDRCDKWHGNIAGGFVITEDGIAVTNYHVMESKEARAFGALTADGKIHYVEEVLAASKRDDLAIVRLSGDGFKPAPVAAGAPVGSKAIAISHPEGRFFTVSEGIISRYYRQSSPKKNSGAERVAITADFAKGSSGCPVYSDLGEVIGVVSSTSSIYYMRGKDGVQSNLQMVIKSCIPSSSILKLIRESEDSGTEN